MRSRLTISTASRILLIRVDRLPEGVLIRWTDELSESRHGLNVEHVSVAAVFDGSDHVFGLFTEPIHLANVGLNRSITGVESASVISREVTADSS